MGDARPLTPKLKSPLRHHGQQLQRPDVDDERFVPRDGSRHRARSSGHKQMTEKRRLHLRVPSARQNQLRSRTVPTSTSVHRRFSSRSPSGRRMLVAGQKSGIVHALDPDKNGEVLWQTRVGRGGTMGGVQWGSATDQSNIYVALSDIGRIMLTYSNSTGADPKQGGGMFALQLEDGERVWYTPPTRCGTRQRCSPAQSAAVSAPAWRRRSRARWTDTCAPTLPPTARSSGTSTQSRPTTRSTACQVEEGKSMDRARRSAAGWCCSTRATPPPAAHRGTFCSRFQSTAKNASMKSSERSGLAAIASTIAP